MELHTNKDFSAKTVNNQGKMLKRLSRDVDITRANLWNEVINTRNRINSELKTVKELTETKDNIRTIFKRASETITLSLKDFDKSHSKEDISRLSNELADRSETLHASHSPLYSLEDKWDKEDLQELAKLLDEGWAELKAKLS